MLHDSRLDPIFPPQVSENLNRGTLVVNLAPVGEENYEIELNLCKAERLATRLRGSASTVKTFVVSHSAQLVKAACAIVRAKALIDHTEACLVSAMSCALTVACR